MKKIPGFFVFITFLISLLGSQSHVTAEDELNSVKKRPETNGAPLIEIPAKHRLSVVDGDQLLIMLDLAPVIDSIKPLADPALFLRGAASFYANEYFNTDEYSSISKALVHIVHVKDMDEYARQNYAGMTRFGTISFHRKNGKIELLEDLLVVPDLEISAIAPLEPKNKLQSQSTGAKESKEKVTVGEVLNPGGVVSEKQTTNKKKRS